MKNKVIYLLGIAFLFSSPLFAQGIELEAEAGSLKEYMQTITAEELKDHLMILASDDYEGRETGQLGQKLAADYIARHFMANELEGPVEEHPNPYYQPINFRGRYVSSVTLRSPNAELELGKDFTTRSLSDVQEEGLEVVFAGYGIEREDYNDFEDLDVEGKGIIVISG
jgi:hypothetical protein